jgi:hypothetical protein
MNWARISTYVERAETGAQICAARVADGWRYSAWSAPADPGLSDWDWAKAHAQEHIPRGGRLLQRVRPLGVYLTAAEARAACEADATASNATYTETA